MSMINVMAII